MLDQQGKTDYSNIYIIFGKITKKNVIYLEFCTFLPNFAMYNQQKLIPR